MNLPFEGELTATEERVYDAISDPIMPVSTTPVLAQALDLKPPVVAAVCDGLEAMGFIRRHGGLWVPDYREV